MIDKKQRRKGLLRDEVAAFDENKALKVSSPPGTRVTKKATPQN